MIIYAKTSETTEATYDTMMDTNTKCHFFLSKDAIPYLKESKGKYVTGGGGGCTFIK